MGGAEVVDIPFLDPEISFVVVLPEKGKSEAKYDIGRSEIRRTFDITYDQ